MAVEPAGDEPVSAILAGPYGGNLVLRELTVGSSLFLPVAKPGGRVWVGDVHALQGDGVVDQTAIETAADDLQIRYDLHKQAGSTAPLAETPTHWIGIGFGDSLDDALVACLRELIAWLHARSGISEGEAYALCSMAVSFRVTQYAHQTGSAYTSIPPKAVHGLVPKSVFPDELVQRIDGWLRHDGGTTGDPLSGRPAGHPRTAGPGGQCGDARATRRLRRAVQSRTGSWTVRRASTAAAGRSPKPSARSGHRKVRPACTSPSTS